MPRYSPNTLLNNSNATIIYRPITDFEDPSNGSSGPPKYISCTKLTVEDFTKNQNV